MSCCSSYCIEVIIFHLCWIILMRQVDQIENCILFLVHYPDLHKNSVNNFHFRFLSYQEKAHWIRQRIHSYRPGCGRVRLDHATRHRAQQRRDGHRNTAGQTGRIRGTFFHQRAGRDVSFRLGGRRGRKNHRRADSGYAQFSRRFRLKHPGYRS